jgi:hypothetical protein
MAVDTGIYGQIRPFTMGDPYESAGKVLAIKDAQRKFTLEDDIAAAGAASGGDPEKMASALLEKGHYGPAIQLRGQAASLDKEKRLAKNAEIEQKLKLAEAAGSDAMMLDQVYRQALQQFGGDRASAVSSVQLTYQQARQKWASMGVNLPESFDPDQNFSYIGQAKEAIQYLKTLAPEVVMTDTGGSVTPMNKNPMAGPVGPMAGSTPTPKTATPAAPTELSRLISERDALPQGDPRRAQYERVIGQYKAGRGTDITIQQPGPMTPGKSAGNKVDEEILDTTKGLMRLDTIASQFKPEYQTMLTRGEQWWSSVKEKAGVNLKVKEKKDLEEFSSYKRNAINSLNEYIKMITGAAMSEAEAQRILRGMPNPGQGIFDGDSPTEFKAKLDDAMKQTKMAVARLAYIKRKGMSLEDGLGKGLTLEGMPALINQRGQDIEGQLKASQPDVKGEALKRAVRRQLGVEFGLVSD